MDSEEDWESDAGQVMRIGVTTARRAAGCSAVLLLHSLLRADADVADGMLAAMRQGFARVSSSESEAPTDDTEDGPSAPGRDGGQGSEEARP